MRRKNPDFDGQTELPTHDSKRAKITGRVVDDVFGYAPLLQHILSFADWQDKVGAIPLVNRAFNAAAQNEASWRSLCLSSKPLMFSDTDSVLRTAQATAFLTKFQARFGPSMRVLKGLHRLVFSGTAHIVLRCRSLKELHWHLESASDFEEVARSLPQLEVLSVHSHIHPSYCIWSQAAPRLLGSKLQVVHLPLGVCIDKIGEFCPQLEDFSGAVTGDCLRSMSSCHLLSSLSILAFLGDEDDFVVGAHTLAAACGQQLWKLELNFLANVARTDTYASVFASFANHCTRLVKLSVHSPSSEMLCDYLLPLVEASGGSLEVLSAYMPAATSQDLVRCADYCKGEQLTSFQFRTRSLYAGLDLVLHQFAARCHSLRQFSVDGPGDFDMYERGRISEAALAFCEALPELHFLQVPSGCLMRHAIESLKTSDVTVVV